MEFKEKIIVIGDHDTCAGFAIAGVREVIYANTKTSEEIFLRAISRSDAGVIILQEDLAREFSHKTVKLLESLPRPVIVKIPSKNEALNAKKSGSIRELVKRAIGIELKT